MTLVITILARLGLLLTILPPILFLFDGLPLDSVKWVMVLGTLLWLGAAPVLQKKHEATAASHSGDHL